MGEGEKNPATSNFKLDFHRRGRGERGEELKTGKVKSLSAVKPAPLQAQDRQSLAKVILRDLRLNPIPV
jgi:hypothetical protein